MNEYRCNYCDKKYTNKHSLYNHRRLKHSVEKQLKQVNNEQCNNEKLALVSRKLALVSPKVSRKLAFISIDDYVEDNTLISCKYCDKTFKHKSSKSRHQKKCKEVNKDSDVVLKEELEEGIKQLKAEMLQLMNKRYKMHPKTFAKLRRDLKANKQSNSDNTNNNVSNINNTINNVNADTVNNTDTINTDNSNNSHNNITNNTQNNNTQNNININVIPIGKEDFVNTLSKKQQIETINKVYDCIKHLCNITHFNPTTPQYHSFAITNMQNTVAYSYDDEEKDYSVVSKEELMEELIFERANDIRDFLEFNAADINPKIAIKINNFIDKLDINKLFFKKKANDLKVLIYNKTRNIDITEFKKLNYLKN